MKEARNKSIPPKEHHIVIVQLSQKKCISIIGLQLARFQEQGDSVVFGWEYQSPMQSILKGDGGPSCSIQMRKIRKHEYCTSRAGI